VEPTVTLMAKNFAHDTVAFPYVEAIRRDQQGRRRFRVTMYQAAQNARHYNVLPDPKVVTLQPNGDATSPGIPTVKAGQTCDDTFVRLDRPARALRKALP
jgi:hypothetical protein